VGSSIVASGLRARLRIKIARIYTALKGFDTRGLYLLSTAESLYWADTGPGDATFTIATTAARRSLIPRRDSRGL
jgi:hypothetical protein